MKLRRTTRPNVWLMNLIPVVDVVFLLLVFFLLGTTFVLQPGIQIKLPFSPFLLGPLANPKIVSITDPPHPRIFFDNRQIDPEHTASLLDALGEPATVLIKADLNTTYDLVTKVASTCIGAGHTVVLATSSERPVESVNQKAKKPSELPVTEGTEQSENRP